MESALTRGGPARAALSSGTPRSLRNPGEAIRDGR